MQKTDTAELRRLWEAANKPDVVSTTEYGYLAFRAFSALPSLIDELEAAREKAESAELNWKLTQERATRWAKESTALAAHVERLKEAVRAAMAVLSGQETNKSMLIHALELCQQAMKEDKENDRQT